MPRTGSRRTAAWASRSPSLIGQLKALNIPVVAATGNSFNGQQGEGFTSIVDGVISVTATDTSDHLLPDAQRLGSTVGMGTAPTWPPRATGFVAPSGDNQLLGRRRDQLRHPPGQRLGRAAPADLPAAVRHLAHRRPGDAWLEQGADPIHDPVTGITIGRLDIPKAASLIPSPRRDAGPRPRRSPCRCSTPVCPTPQARRHPVARRSRPTPVASHRTSGDSDSGRRSHSDARRPSSTTPAPAPPSTVPSTDVQVFVNGQQVNSLDASDPSQLDVAVSEPVQLAAHGHECLGRRATATAAGSSGDRARFASGTLPPQAAGGRPRPARPIPWAAWLTLFPAIGLLGVGDARRRLLSWQVARLRIRRHAIVAQRASCVTIRKSAASPRHLSLAGRCRGFRSSSHPEIRHRKGVSLGRDTEDGAGHRGRKRNRPGDRQDPGCAGPAAGPARPRRKEAGADPCRAEHGRATRP